LGAAAFAALGAAGFFAAALGAAGFFAAALGAAGFFAAAFGAAFFAAAAFAAGFFAAVFVLLSGFFFAVAAFAIFKSVKKCLASTGPVEEPAVSPENRPSTSINCAYYKTRDGRSRPYRYSSITENQAFW